MLKKVIGFLFVLLLVFSRGAFAEDWQEVENGVRDTGYKVYYDSDSVKEQVLSDQLVVATVRVKIVVENSGDATISVSEYKTSPVKADSQGIFYRPRPLEVRVVEVHVYDRNGKELKRMVDYNRPWEKVRSVHEISFNIWYMVAALSKGGTMAL